MAITIKWRRDLASRWVEKNPVLASGEAGWERDTRKLKVGDGVTPWNELGYFNGELPQEAVAGAVAQYLEDNPVASYVHNQQVPSDTWVMAHPLPYTPNVTFTNSAGDQFIPDNVRFETGVIVATLAAAQGGKAYMT